MDGMAGMGHGGMTSAPPPSIFGPKKKRLIMHMTFFWGSITEVLFDNWPGTKGGVHYAGALVVVFLLAVLVEWISRFQIAKAGGANHRVVKGLLRTLIHTVRMGLAYLVMLAVMSYNGGVFLAVVAGHAVGFLIFGARVFQKSGGENGLDQGNSDLNGVAC